MRARLAARASFLILGVAASAAVTWAISGWPLQPSVPLTVGMMTNPEHAAWMPLHRGETFVCFVLNAVFYSAAVWVTAGVASLLFRSASNGDTAARGPTIKGLPAA